MTNSTACAARPAQPRSRYTGKERDTESGLDYFGARYFGSSMGRFMSPDWSSVPDTVPHADFNDPQTLNLYAYAANNPVSFSDSDGHSVQICSTDASGNQHCNTNYSNAANGNNGGLNVPSEQSVERTGSGNITDSNGNVVGTARYHI
jgi:RHS repeat-associated protein